MFTKVYRCPHCKSEVEFAVPGPFNGPQDEFDCYASNTALTCQACQKTCYVDVDPTSGCVPGDGDFCAVLARTPDGAEDELNEA